MTTTDPRTLVVQQDVHRDVLPNGLTVLVRRDTSAPVVAIVTHVKAGYFDESDDVVGISHVLEHMYFKGTPTRGVGAVARETKSVGGWLNAHTIYDETAYVTVLPSASFERGLDIQFDAYAHSLIDEGELARELEVIIQEARRKRDAPGAVTVESLFALLHDHHRIRRWRIGDPEQLRTFTRDQVTAFYRRWYVPGNTIVSVVGDVDPMEVHRAVRARYGTLPAADTQRDPAPVERTASGFRLQELTGDVAQSHVAIGWRAPASDHPDTPALDVAGAVLSSGRASRFYRALRERQRATSASAWGYTPGNIGVFVASAEAPPERLAEATHALWREMHAARQSGVSEAEVERAKRVIDARLLRRLESMDGQASWLASWEAEGGIVRGEAYVAALRAVTPADVQRALTEHCDPAQAAVLTYRPSDTPPLATDAESLQRELANARGDSEGIGPAVRVAPAAPALHLTMRAEQVEAGVHLFRTTRGTPILVRPRPGAPLVNVGVFARGGALREPAGHDGLARLTAQVQLKGTRTRSGSDLALAAEMLGGSIGVSSALEHLGWSLSVPTHAVDDAVALLADVVQRPSFPVDALDTERQLALAELERQRDDMYRWPMRLATMAAYGDHPYARSVLGTESSLPRVGIDDVVQFHEAAVLNGSTLFGVVGDVDPAHVAALISAHLDALDYHDDPSPSVPVWPTQLATLHDTRDKQQTALAMLFPGPARHADARFTARVLAAIASGLGGRFFEALRDQRSLAYTVAAYPVERRASGSFAAYIATEPAREEEARDGLLEEFARFRNADVTDEELDRARAYLIGTHAMSQQSGASILADVVDAWCFGGGLQELDEFNDHVSRVTTADIRAFAAAYFEPERRVEGVVRGQGAPAA